MLSQFTKMQPGTSRIFCVMLQIDQPCWRNLVTWHDTTFARAISLNFELDDKDQGSMDIVKECFDTIALSGLEGGGRGG